jgi:hypothetical protein
MELSAAFVGCWLVLLALWFGCVAWLAPRVAPIIRCWAQTVVLTVLQVTAILTVWLWWPWDMLRSHGEHTRSAEAPCGMAGGGDLTSGLGVSGAHAGMALEEATASRLRRRTRWVRSLECSLGGEIGCVGKLVRGRWRPDLASPERNHAVNLLLSHFDNGARLLGGGVRSSVRPVRVEGTDGEEVRTEAYFVLELADGSREVVFPELLFALASYAFLRERDALLVGSLRLRALDWCKKVGLSWADTWMAVSSAVHLAWRVSPRERQALAAFAGKPHPSVSLSGL